MNNGKYLYSFIKFSLVIYLNFQILISILDYRIQIKPMIKDFHISLCRYTMDNEVL